MKGLIQNFQKLPNFFRKNTTIQPEPKTTKNEQNKESYSERKEYPTHPTEQYTSKQHEDIIRSNIKIHPVTPDKDIFSDLSLKNTSSREAKEIFKDIVSKNTKKNINWSNPVSKGLQREAIKAENKGQKIPQEALKDTALHLSIFFNAPEALSTILEDANSQNQLETLLNTRDSKGRTPLEFAEEQRILKRELYKNSDEEIKGIKTSTIIENDYGLLIDTLRKYGASLSEVSVNKNPNIANTLKHSELLTRIDTVMESVDIPRGSLISSSNNLIQAKAQFNNSIATNIGKGVDWSKPIPSDKSRGTGETALHRASFLSSITSVKMLLHDTPNSSDLLKTRDEKGRTPFELALMRFNSENPESEEVIKFFCSCGETISSERLRELFPKPKNDQEAKNLSKKLEPLETLLENEHPFNAKIHNA